MLVTRLATATENTGLDLDRRAKLLTPIRHANILIESNVYRAFMPCAVGVPAKCLEALRALIRFPLKRNAVFIWDIFSLSLSFTT